MSKSTLTVEEVLARLKGVEKTASGWNALCPAHDDSRPSLSVVKKEPGGKLLLKCHGGCEFSAIMAAIKAGSEKGPSPTGGACGKPSKIVVTYDYLDPTGKLLFQVVRYEPKNFRQRVPDAAKPGGWTWSLKGVTRVLYRLPQIIQAVRDGTRIYVVEGEKDSGTLVKHGFEATCNSGGAGKWLDQYSETLTAADVVIVPDRDEAGRKHAELVATKLAGKAKSLRILDLPESGGQTVKDVTDWFEAGGTAAELRQLTDAAPAWSQPAKQSEKADCRPQIALPGVGRPDSQFASEIGRVMAKKCTWFNQDGRIVEVRLKDFSEHVRCWQFDGVTPARAITAIEQHISTGRLLKEQDGRGEFIVASMTEKTAKVLLSAAPLIDQLPKIARILGVRIPVIHEQKLVLPALGYDPRFSTFTNPHAPAFKLMEMSEAKWWLCELHRDFCFDSTRSCTHAVARLLTPACRGLMGWDARGPLWLYSANRERLGKDCLAGCVAIIFDGFPGEDAPLEPRNLSETRKRVTAAVLAGRNRMHFANCRGHLAAPVLESAITASVWCDRILGVSQEVRLPMEIEFSLSANTGLTYTPDIAHRCRRVGLFYPGENPNARRFAHPNLFGWVRKHRAELLSAVISLIHHWFLAGMPPGLTPFASFPQWAEVVGGVMAFCGLGDPCLPDDRLSDMDGDEETSDMRSLFVVGLEQFGARRVGLSEIINLIRNENDHV